MKLSRFVLAMALGGASVAAIHAPRALAFDAFWIPTGSSSWNSGANWADVEGGGPRNAIPGAAFEEVGVINNGGTATLNVPIGESTGGVVLGRAATNSGTLAINSGGVFTSVASATTDGIVYVGVGGTGTLSVTGTGSLTAPALNIGGLAASQASLSGSASVSLAGAATVSRGLRVTGPSVNFSAGSVALQGTSVLTHEITSPSAHSPLKAIGNVALGGTLAVQFNGVTPVVNSAWTLVDAASISGNFANGAVGGAIQVTGAPAPALGSAYRLRQVAGGTNGQQLQVALETMLVLQVNRDTGELSIRNPLGAPVTQLDGYTISSPNVGSLLTGYKGISGAPAGNAGWEKAPGNSVSGLVEFKPTGSFNVSAAGTTVSLGNGFNKTAVASQGLGVNGEDLLFSYHATGGAVVTGQVEYVGTPFLNNISLIVNTTTGMASLKNDTLQSLSIDGYSILSSTGALNGGTWTSLADRAGTYPNWQESPTTVNALSETNPVAPMAIPAGTSISLGNIGNFATQAAKDGLSMKFLLGNEQSFRLATVHFTSGAALAGDYDGNSRVDGADFLLWQRSFGQTVAPGTGADGDGNGSVGAGDLAVWRSNFGAGGATAAAGAVPEPGAGALLSAAVVAVLGYRSRQRGTA